MFFFSQRGNSVDFLDFIEHQVLPVLSQFVPSHFTFQQDLVPTHTSQYAFDDFAELGINLLPWASRSLDLNSIVNCWAWLTGKVYDGEQFNNRSEGLV